MHILAVVGAGTMGRGIAQLAAQRGLEVQLYDPNPSALEAARRALHDIFVMLADKGRLETSVELVERRLHYRQTLEPLAEADWVIEAAPERLELKQDLFAALDRATPKALLATNTSTLSVTRIAAATSRPGDVIGLHFFNPAPLMKLVEVIPGLETRPGVVDRALALVDGLGKTPVVAKDRPGFVVNRVARPFYGEALRLAAEGVEVETIDAIMRGLGFRMGPFELIDLIGLDINLAATKSVYEAFFHEPRYRPHPLQQAMVDAGRLGRKSGQGFYDYTQSHDVSPVKPKATGEPPATLIIGGTPLADELRARFPTVEQPLDADLVLDARINPQEKLHARLAEELPVVTLLWGHSASAVTRGYRRGVAGFSLVPPIEEDTLVELYLPLSGLDDALEPARIFFEGNGIATVTLPDQPGGVGFRIVAMLINEAVSAVAEELAPPEAIDRAMKLGTHYPFGPLEWSERLGLKALLSALEGLHDELGEDRYRPHPLLKRMVAAGLEGWR